MPPCSSILTRSLFAATALLVASAQSLVAQGTGTIRGRVTEAGTGRPVPDARVTITGRQQGAVTSPTGDYTISKRRAWNGGTSGASHRLRPASGGRSFQRPAAYCATDEPTNRSAGVPGLTQTPLLT